MVLGARATSPHNGLELGRPAEAGRPGGTIRKAGRPRMLQPRRRPPGQLPWPAVGAGSALLGSVLNGSWTAEAG